MAAKRKPRPQEVPSPPIAVRHTGLSVLVASIATVFMLALTVPWVPVRGATIGYFDYSWMLVLHDAIATGRQFGRDLIIPYGPLGFIATNIYDPRTYLLLIIIRVLMSLIVMRVLWEAAAKLFANPLAALPWLMGIIVLMGPGMSASQTAGNNFDPRMLGGAEDHFFSICALLALLAYFAVHQRAVTGGTVAMIVVLAAASLTKVNFLMQDIVVVGAISLDQLFKPPPVRRRWLVPVVYVGCLALFYVSARQSPASLRQFGWGWAAVTFGHMDAVGLPGPGIDLIAYLMIAVLLVCLIGYVEWKKRGRGGLLPVAAAAALFALLYKHSFLRQDFAHATIAPMAAFAAAIFYAPIAWKTSSGKLFQGVCLTIVTLAGVVVWSSLAALTGESLPELGWVALVRTGDALEAVADDLTSPARLHAEWESQRAALRRDNPLPLAKIAGPTDVYPHRQDILLAYSFPYDPRPAYSSLFATAPALAELNAQHLVGPAAPQTILFDIEPVDHQFPALADGWSWPELLTRYELADKTGALLVLRRRASPGKYRLVPSAKLAGAFGQSVAIPNAAAGPIWARIYLHRRGIGRMISTLYKPPLVQMDVQTRDGAVAEYRLLPELAEQGFLLSPVVSDQPGFAALMSNRQAELTPAQVKQITISVVDGSQELNYDSAFTVELDRLEIYK
ncbi:MAG TPA: hypothetical protein VFE47_02435 [Tepidisphaeraceae bacterium]|jgi:hypothetical protein|nr:hypothetical protein [Tepidisphaeraceae bacterium]